MFGYVLINKPEMKFKEYDEYHAYYCGLCKQLKKRHGFFSRLTVNYDLTFLALLLSSLYDTTTTCSCENCIVHPFEKMKTVENSYLAYCADMNVYLAYLKCMDDWKDERKAGRFFYACLLKRQAKKIEQQYPQKTKKIMQYMMQLSDYERENRQSLDDAAGVFGLLMEEVVVFRTDEWEDYLRQTGFFLGKFIYLMDAYEDLEKDKKEKNYNPFLAVEEREDFEEYVRKVLMSMMAECCKAFEMLPIVEHVDILRNILYSGVWTSYNKLQKNKSVD